MDNIHEGRSESLDHNLDGAIYNQALPPLQPVPNIDELLDTADIPKCTGESLPFSLEWYAGAKDRQIARDAEKKVCIVQKNSLRSEWTGLILDGLGMWIEKVGNINQEPDPLDLSILLARSTHERPNDTEAISKLTDADMKAEVRRKYWRQELVALERRLTTDDDTIRKKQQRDDQDEADRVAKEKADKDKRKRNERLMQQQAAMLAGTDPPPDYDSNEEDQEDDEPPIIVKTAKQLLEESGGDMLAAGAIETYQPSPQPSLVLSTRESPRADVPSTLKAPLGPSPLLMAPAASLGVPPLSLDLQTQPVVRGGLGTPLPPLADPPPAPKLPTSP